MLKVISLEKSYSSSPLFEDINFTINPGERIGLVGRNGHGKSTLLKIITDQEDPDSGQVSYPKDYKLGYLEQHIDFKEQTILEVACRDLAKSEDGIDLSYKAKAILDGLGFQEQQYTEAPSTLSGGYQIRLTLARLLVSEPNLLLLDEPTNYLDILSVRWLVRFLNKWPGELMLITHDRDFMDSVTTHTIGIHRQKVRKVAGQTEKYYKLLAEEEELSQKTRENQLKKRKETELFIERFRAKASKAKSVQSKIKALKREGLTEKLDDIKGLDFKFPYELFRGDWPVHIKDLSFAYPKGPSIVSNFSFSLRTSEKVAIIGKNGKGKSTLLNLLAKELAAEKTKNSIKYAEKTIFSFFGQTNINRLNPSLTIEEEVIAENPSLNRSIARNICGSMLFSGSSAEKKIKVLSGGEKARVLLAKLLVRSANLLLLDEPTNHLDMDSCAALTSALSKYPGSIIFVSHDEGLLKQIATRLIVFDRGELIIFDGGYQEFLDKIGWHEEEGIVKKNLSSDKKRISKAERRKLRSQVIKERQDTLKPLSNKINKIEKKIMNLEEEIKQASQDILDSTGESDKISELSKKIGLDQNTLSSLYEDLDVLAEEHSSLEKDFKDKLEAI